VVFCNIFMTKDKQEKFTEIKEDLENLKRLNVDIYSITCDGHKAILKAIKTVYPQVIYRMLSAY